jgi:succinoglycan biosynthesis transport protein ExoP
MMIIQPDFRGTVVAFLRRKALFVLIVSIVCGAGGAYLLLTKPLYQAGASLVVRFDTHSLPNIDRTKTETLPLGSNERREIIYSDADILRSRDVVRSTIKALGVPRTYPAVAAKPLDDEHKLDDAAELFSANLVVDVGLQSDVISVSYLNPDPTVARDAVQQLLDTFYGQEATVYANPELRFAKDEAAKARENLTEAQNALAAFKAGRHIADLQQQVSQLLLQRTDVESRLNIAHARMAEAEQRETTLKQLLRDVPENVSSSAPGEQYHAVDQAEAKLDELRAKRSQMASNYRSDSPLFQQVDSEIAALQTIAKQRTQEAQGRASSTPNLVHQNINTDYLRASAEANSAREPERVLTAQLADINQRLSGLEAERNQYDDMVRAVQIQNDTYRTLAIRYETASVEANRNAQKISAAAVIAAPAVPNHPARPRRKLVALATLLAALVLAVGGVLTVEAMDDRLNTPRDVVRVLRLPVLATFTSDT